MPNTSINDFGAAHAFMRSTVDFYRHDRVVPYGAFLRAWNHLPKSVQYGNGNGDVQGLFRDAFNAASNSEPSLHIAKAILMALETSIGGAR